MHQKARFERLCKELEEERRNLNDMKIQTAQMEREVGDKLNHRSPYPKVFHQAWISILERERPMFMRVCLKKIGTI